jgi:hypothetical protein
MTRITATAPEALEYECNQLAMCLAYSLADGLTYRGLNWQDSNGNLYSAASWEASEAWVEGASQPLVRPAWDVDEVIDMDAAAIAQAALVFSSETILAVPDKLTAMSGPDAVVALELMGLTAKEMPIGE